MYFWNDKKLSIDLKENKISQRDVLNYFFILLIMDSISAMYVLKSSNNQGLTLLSALIALIIHLVGISLCFKNNEQGDGKNFLDRLICLALPINIKVMVWWGLCTVIMLFFGALILRSGIMDIFRTKQFLVFAIIYSTAPLLFIYYFLKQRIAFVSSNK